MNQALINYSLPNQESSLFYGKAGEAVLCSIMNIHCNDINYSDKTYKLLDEIYTDIYSVEHLGFANGLTGIGWAIEWIAQNTNIKLNTNEILEDVDDELYKIVIYSIDKSISLTDGINGKIEYFYKRFCNSKHSHRYKSILHEECLVILSDRLSDLIIEIISSNDKSITHDNILGLGYSLISLSNLVEARINSVICEETLYNLISYTDKFLNNLGDEEVISLNTIYLIICYKMAGITHNHNYWQCRANKFFNKTIKFNEFFLEINNWRCFSIYNLSKVFFNFKSTNETQLISDDFLVKINDSGLVYNKLIVHLASDSKFSTISLNELFIVSSTG